MPNVTFTDPFGGFVLQPANVSLREVSLTADVTLVWPAYATDDNFLAGLMRVTPTGAYAITQPDATLASNGVGAIYTNLGASTITLKDASGATIATVASGAVKYVYITDNSTSAGSWAVVTLGAGAANLDAGALAGPGLKAIGATLGVALNSVEVSTDQTISATTSRAVPYVWTGGAGTFSLPSLVSATDDFFFEVRNQGTGVLTLDPDGAETIDGSSTVALQVNESCFVHAGPTSWFTVGRGRNTQFNFTQLNKTVTGGTTTLSLTEASNVIHTYSGVLVSNQIIVLPALVQIYYVSNETTGNYTLTFQTPTPNDSISIDRNERAILFCDGVNVYNAATLVNVFTDYPALNIVGKAATFTLAAGDLGKVFTMTSTWTLPMQNPATLGNGWYVDFTNSGTGIITLDPNGYPIDGSAAINRNIYPGESFRLASNGAQFYTIGRSKQITMSSHTFNAETSYDVETGFGDTELERIKIQWSNMVFSAAPNLQARVKKGGAYLTSATYSQSAANLTTAALGQTSAAGATSWDLSGGVAIPALALDSGEIEVSAFISSGTVNQMVRSYNFVQGNAFADCRTSNQILYNTGGGNVQGIRVMVSAGNIAQGSILVTATRK